MSCQNNNISLFTSLKGSNIPFPPPGRMCSCPTQTSGLKNCPTPNTPGNTSMLLICGMLVVVVLLSLYSAIITGVYIRLRVILILFIVVSSYCCLLMTILCIYYYVVVSYCFVQFIFEKQNCLENTTVD